MKIIFLDFDGVILAGDSYKKLNNKYRELHHERNSGVVTNKVFYLYCAKLITAQKESVDVVNNVIQTTGASIVISSTWRLGFNLPRLRKQLKTWGIIGKVIGQIPDRGQFKELAIHEWLTRNRKKVTSYVVLDDYLIPEMNGHQVRTIFAQGLREKHKPGIIRILDEKV